MKTSRAKRAPDSTNTVWRQRSWAVQGGLLCCALAVLAGAANLQVRHRQELEREADSRYWRAVSKEAPRTAIVDRNGYDLAVSAQTAKIWTDPTRLKMSNAQADALARVLGLDVERMKRRLAEPASPEYVRLKHHATPVAAAQVRSLGIKGVYVSGDYRRYYPMAEAAAHLLGITEENEQREAGIEGVEKSFDDYLYRQKNQLLQKRDLRGRVVEFSLADNSAETVAPLQLSMDQQLQYNAYRELKTAVERHGAKGGSLVMLDVQTGEVLVMVNQPSFNPHVRSQLNWTALRNRAVVNTFEPGSTIKPLVIAAALEMGAAEPHKQIQTAPSYVRVGNMVVKDPSNYGLLDLAGIIRKSSNVGMTKLALSMPREQMWSVLDRFGFGLTTSSGLPGEVGGHLPHYRDWGRVRQATLSYGYGLSVTTLQLAQAYAALADGGIAKPVSLVKVESGQVAHATRQVLRPEVAAQVLKMMEAVTEPGGTGQQAAIAGYRVAGKTGTVVKYAGSGYEEDRYRALFAGVAPVSKPRFALVVMVDEPSLGEYYGGRVAAPVFRNVMAEALRNYNIAPDALRPEDAYVQARFNTEPGSLRHFSVPSTTAEDSR